MAQVLSPKPAEATLPVFFNVEGVVGSAPADNRGEDVLLVQFFMSIVAATPTAKTEPELIAAFKRVSVSGSIDQATIDAIRTYQHIRRNSDGPSQVVDGRISPARGYRFGNTIYTIVLLNDMVQNRNTDIWPRIDRIPGCPTALKTLVERELVGKGFPK